MKQRQNYLAWSSNWIAWLALCVSAGAWAQSNPDTQGLLPLDPGAQGYKVDNNVMQFKEQLLLPKNVTFQTLDSINSRYRVGNLLKDESGIYERYPEKIVAIADSQTGEVKRTQYVGDVKCYADGNIAISISNGKKEDWVFSIGKFGGVLEAFRGGVPEGMTLNKMSCQLMPWAKVPKTLKDGTQLDWRERLRVEHGFFVVKRGRNYSADTKEFSPELQALMRQPFMRSMEVTSPVEAWYLITPTGEEIAIPNNPGEAAGQYGGNISYLAYLGAYFILPYADGRPFDPPELRRIPHFARLLYPDGRVERFGVPDVIREAYERSELSYTAFYTKRGMIWLIRNIDPKRYQGELKAGFYLDERNTKVLRRLPRLGLTAAMPLDGCKISVREEVTQRRPYVLQESYFINICSGE